MSILVHKTKATTRTLSVRIPGTLAADLDSLKSDAEAAGFTLDTSSIVTAALAKAVKDARATLAAVPADASPPMPHAHNAAAGIDVDNL